MAHDVTCPKCKYAFPVMEARHAIGVECPGCAGDVTVEFIKRASPAEPGVSPYEVVVMSGKPPAAAATPEQPTTSKKIRRGDDDEDEEKEQSSRGGGSTMVVVFAGLTALLFALGGLGTTGYFLFTNLDTSDATLNNLSSPNVSQGSLNPGRNSRGNLGGTPDGKTNDNESATPGTPGGGNTPAPKKQPFQLAPVTGDPPKIKPPSLSANSYTLSLGSKAGAVAIAGGGRYIVMHFPESGHLGVFDANTAQVTLTSTDTGEVKLAAGLSLIVTYIPSSRIMRVFSIVEPKGPNQKLTMPKLFDSTISPPGPGIGSIGMGSRTNGPLIGIGNFGALHVFEISANSIKEIEEARRDNLDLDRGNCLLHATPDGQAYLTCDNLEKGQKVKMAYWDDKQWKKREMKLTPFPGQNGLLYGNGIVTNLEGDDLRYGGAGLGSDEWFVPAVCGTSGAFLKVAQVSMGKDLGAKKTVTVTIHNKGNASKPAEGTPTFSGLPEFEGLWGPFDQAARERPFDQHLFLFPEAKLLVILSTDREKLLLRKIDLK